MSLFVYVSANCTEDARTHGLLTEVQRLQERVESSQSTSLFDPFPPPYLVKKKLGGRQGRLIADRRTVGEHAVIVCLAILIRGHREYEEFAADPVNYGKHNFSDVVSDQEVLDLVKQRTALRPAEVKPDPNDSEYALLYGAFSHYGANAPEELVCETQEWVEQVGQERVSKQLALLCRPCLNALGREAGLHFINVVDKPGWGIWALRAPGRLLLITPATDTNATAAEQFAKRIGKELADGDPDQILRASRRAYPALILADDELWIDLEKEPVANMALSPEESEVLESARRPDHPFPLFINGRAGSGKSTVLQYLFADLLFYYLSKPEAQVIAPPIYLTANGELLRIARTFVERLLRSEATFTQQSNRAGSDGDREILDEAFREFQPYLLSLLTVEDRLTEFAKANRVDYSRFRRLWTDRFGKDNNAKRQFSADLSWHVIRTYIKGISSETYLEPEDYAHLPENQITVTHEAFRLVHDRVWVGWYQPFLAEEHLWDDQDLARQVLERGLIKPTHPAVFCDEAQDFTRLELELLLRLNLFSNRSLPPSDIGRVPFAFAGDQFQTLNPTGFRWDSIKASFAEKFIFELDPAQKSGRTDLNYCELEFNYRSTDKIVRFGNHVQAMRAALFGLPDLKPQTPWAAQPQSFPVVWFRSNDGEFWKKYREQTGFVVIVPCNEGEETDYVRQDPILREHIKLEDGVPLNVLSASRSKGCEYPAVIVYGFGEAADTNIVEEISNHDSSMSDPDKTLPLQYFVNRLYVAVSRPKRRLVIVDTQAGFDRLWKVAQDEMTERLMLQQIKNGEKVWGPAIEGMTIGDAEDLARESSNDPLENARAFEADGMARQDAFLLRQAAQAYRSAGDMSKAKECRARALDVEEKFNEAGEAYFDAGFVRDGVRCLFHAGRDGWKRLGEMISHHPEIHADIEYQIACRAVGHTDSKKISDALRMLARRLDDADFASQCAGDAIWPEAVGALIARLLEQPLSDSNGLAQIGHSLDRIRERGIILPATTAAQLFYRMTRYRDAIALWDTVGANRSPEYLRAKAAVEPYPDNVSSLSKLGLRDEIVKSYTAQPDVNLNPEQTSIIVSALRDIGRIDEALTLALFAESASAMLELALFLFRTNDRDKASGALRTSLRLLVQEENWEAVGGFAATGKLHSSAEWKSPDVVAWVSSELPDLQSLLVRCLARSNGLPDAPAHYQRQLAEFMRTYLRVKDGRWRDTVSVREAGAAFERTGRFTDALLFYEALQKDHRHAGDHQFAHERWLVCKDRQLAHERSQNATNKVKKIENEIRKEMERLGLASLENLTSYPSLKPLTETPQEDASDSGTSGGVPGHEVTAQESTKVQKFTLSIQRFMIDVSREHGRCNITDSKSLETAFLKVSENRCGGEMEFVEVERNTWNCAAWGMTVVFPSDAAGELTIEIDDVETSVVIRW